jgi:hypothetical protein
MGYQVKPQSPIPHSRRPSHYAFPQPTSTKSPVNFAQYHQRYRGGCCPTDAGHEFPRTRSRSGTRRDRNFRSLDFEVGFPDDSISTSSEAPSYHQYLEEEEWEDQDCGRRRESGHPEADAEAVPGMTDGDAPQLPMAELEPRPRGETANPASPPTTNLHPYVRALTLILGSLRTDL